MYSASSLGRPLVAITFLHWFYLGKFVYVVCTYFRARSTIRICAQSSWRHFPNTDSYLATIFLWHHRHYPVQSWRFMAHSTTNDECFLRVSSRLDLSMSTQNIKIGRLLLAQDSQASLQVSSTTKRLYSSVHSINSHCQRIGRLQVEVTLFHTNMTS